MDFSRGAGLRGFRKSGFACGYEPCRGQDCVFRGLSAWGQDVDLLTVVTRWILAFLSAEDDDDDSPTTMQAVMMSMTTATTTVEK